MNGEVGEGPALPYVRLPVIITAGHVLSWEAPSSGACYVVMLKTLAIK